MPHDADDVIAGREIAVVRRFKHAAERLVTKDQTRVTVRRLAVFARDDLAIGAANAEHQRLGEKRAFGFRRLANLL